MKKYLIVAAIATLTLTGCAAPSEEASPTPSDSSTTSSSSETLAPAEETTTEQKEFAPNDADLVTLIDNLMRSCDKGLAEGMTEEGNAVRFVVLPESEGYESYTAFYEYLDTGESSLIFSLDFSSACYIPMAASSYLESLEGEETISWENFPIKVEQLTNTQFRVVDSSMGEEFAVESVYFFEDGVLSFQELEDFLVTINYGDWTEEDKVKLQTLVDELFAE